MSNKIGDEHLHHEVMRPELDEVDDENLERLYHIAAKYARLRMGLRQIVKDNLKYAGAIDGVAGIIEAINTLLEGDK